MPVRDVSDAITIVVGYDGSDAAKRGLARAHQLGVTRARVVVVAVRPDVRSPALGEPLVERTVDAGRLLDEARGLLASHEHIAVETRGANGDPAEVLVGVARELGADVVIVGRRSSDFVARTLLGSTAERVVRQAPRDVLVVA